MAVDAAAFARYRSALEADLGLALEALRSLMASFPAGAPLDSVRDAMREAYPALVARYGDVAAECACEFYESERARALPDAPAFAPEMPALPDAGILADDVGYRMKTSYGLGAFAPDTAGRAFAASLSRRVMGQADAAVVENARRDPAHPRWAIVPHAGACAFCVMVGSRGFAYTGEGAALSQRHASCTCTPVVDFDKANPHLDGYDPDELYSRWKHLDSGPRRDGAAG